MFFTSYVKNNNKVEIWKDKREDLEEHLRIKAAMDLLNKIPNKGLSLEGKAKLLIQHLPSYNEALDTLDDKIEEWVRPGKK